MVLGRLERRRKEREKKRDQIKAKGKKQGKDKVRFGERKKLYKKVMQV